ncbi:hypothetical protein BIV60_04160 [Bacillus sp. MUM 116]|uniref:DUF3231 family protein n=1 Tax=Bacillus sp. MUM 116 TaxID=1678002 RepID=UPI0008F5F349|nr:DUF3231 family protein [Bacillus sp. MUM 116]OIK16475.1 hypothetical protein BIV60_04160 [Bacillus sp. MUM 116]
MDTLIPINISSKKTDLSEKLTSAELAKLWATYMGNSMSKCILRYYLQHVEDQDIKTLLENALKLSMEFMKTIEEIFKKENFPIPKGFSEEEDLNAGAPRLFEDEYYVFYLRYVAKAGMSIYNIAVPLVYRKDVEEFFVYCMESTMALMKQIKDILMGKGLIIQPPIIPIPDKVEFVHKNFLNGFLGDIRPLHALEITHLYDNIENNVTSKALIMSFSQVVKSKKIRDLFIRGKEFTHKHIENYMIKLHDEDLPTPSFLDHLVTKSTFAPFSDKLMLFHKMDMFSMKIRSFGNSAAVNGRHDIGLMYTNSLLNLASFVNDAAKLMVENGWMEKPPYAVERNKLANEE